MTDHATPGRTIRLSIPKTHSDEDVTHLLDRYRERHPDMFAEWIDVESKFLAGAEGDLRHVQVSVIGFLAEETEHESTHALISCWVDMRGRVVMSLKESE